MGVKELLAQIRKEREQLKSEIERVRKEIIKKEGDPHEFIVNTLWERFKLMKLNQKLEELS